ncbi:MAG: hypothetical protein KJ893_00495 [Candidatus Omnitrophica bacterium]|nr:hypothetical protein [Candidatus Omnitrophota bacterium]MBU4479323.1 hypothetical protein [Candidatus Omnitrophota bacterium]MCG2704237.1 hypothetical protein [Candidatus Omnitrophota bacterium]
MASWDGWIKILIVIWTLVGVGLSCYLVAFPVFMKKNIAAILDVLQRILQELEK